MLKKFLVFGAILGISYAQSLSVELNGVLTERVSGYVRGVEDTLNFLQAELNAKPPQNQYWLWLDITKLPFWQRVALANILKERYGYYPAYLYNALTYRTIFVVDSSNLPDKLLNEAKSLKDQFSALKVIVAKVENPQTFKPVVQIGMCKLPKPRDNYKGINEMLEGAIQIANQIGDKELAKYLQKVLRKVMKYEVLKQEE
jgi:tellurite resistance-related uncharacterized protein